MRVEDWTVDELVWLLRGVLADRPSEWERSFVLSVMRANKRRGWKPSEKQLAHMRRLVERARARGAVPRRPQTSEDQEDGDDLVLIDTDAG